MNIPSQPTLTETEKDDILEPLRRAGLHPEWCDTPVPTYENFVRAGLPADMGDEALRDADEYVWLPKSLVGMHPTFIVEVRGESMREAGIRDGDRVQVQIGVPPTDGDIVMAEVNGGECTIKALCTDERGRRWLVPRNPDFQPILLTEDMQARIIGKVVGHIQSAPRLSYRECLQAIRASEAQTHAEEAERNAQRQAAARRRERLSQTLRAIAPQVRLGRQWYAVYRALLDAQAIDRGDYEGFARTVRQTLPQHPHLPEARYLQRMAVQTFAKPVDLWRPTDAPVAGARFNEYLRIAQATRKLFDTP